MERAAQDRTTTTDGRQVTLEITDHEHIAEATDQTINTEPTDGKSGAEVLTRPAHVFNIHESLRRHQADEFLGVGEDRRRVEIEMHDLEPIVSDLASSSQPSIPTSEQHANFHPTRRQRLREFVRTQFIHYTEPSGVTETHTRQLDNAPNGLPRLAVFMDGNDDYMIFRRFGYLQARLLLEKEARLSQLEKELDDMDWEDYEDDPDLLRTIDYTRRPEFQARQELLARADQYFREYADLLAAVQRLRSYESPSTRDYRALRRFHYNHKPLMDAETDPVRTQEDLVALRPAKEPDWLEHQIERLILITGSSRLIRFFQSPAQRAKTYDKYITLVDVTGSKVTNIATVIVAFLSAILLVLPVLICYILVANVGGSKAYFGCIGILFLFTLIFACSMTFYSKAKRHEVLAATAAYCAVIVVFLGNAAPN